MLPGGARKTPSLARERTSQASQSASLCGPPTDTQRYGGMASEPDASNRRGDRRLGSHPATRSGKTGNVSEAWCSLRVERVQGNGKGAAVRVLKDLQCFREAWLKARVMLQDFPEGHVLGCSWTLTVCDSWPGTGAWTVPLDSGSPAYLGSQRFRDITECRSVAFRTARL